MSVEKVTCEEAIQKLFEATADNKIRLNGVEKKIIEIHQNILEMNTNSINSIPNQFLDLKEKVADQLDTLQTQTLRWQNSTTLALEEKQHQWNQLTDNLRALREEIKRISEIIITKNPKQNETQQSTENDGTSTPQIRCNSSAINDSLDNTQVSQRQNTCCMNHNNPGTSEGIAKNYQRATAQTIIMPPASSIPTFSGNIVENPRQFLIRVREYAETINQWNEQATLNGISQFLRGTALEWYCQIRTSHRRPHTWTEFVTLFLDQFNSPIRKARNEQLWKSCKQEEEETINEFVVRLRALWIEQKPNETEDDLVRHLMCKIRNNLLTMIGVSRCGSLDEIIAEAQKVEEILYQRNRQHYKRAVQDPFGRNISTSVTFSDEEHHELQTMTTDRTTKQRPYKFGSEMSKNSDHQEQAQYRRYPAATIKSQQYSYTTEPIECYACGKHGHMKRNCPNQYDVYSQQANKLSKNKIGAQDRRDHGAPM